MWVKEKDDGGDVGLRTPERAEEIIGPWEAYDYGAMCWFSRIGEGGGTMAGGEVGQRLWTMRMRRLWVNIR